ncbi:Vitamin D 25-hydroxylase, partial [Orchesella cincta]
WYLLRELIKEVALPIILATVILYWGSLRIKKNGFNKKLEVPYGFRGVPGIGFLVHFKDLNCQRKLIEMKERYGKICKVRMGSYECVFLNDYELIRDAWNNSSFCGRPNIPGITLRTKGFKGGIIFNDGRDFTVQRRFVIQHLKNLGFGKSIMESFILEELDSIKIGIENQNGRPMSTHHLFNIASFNILWRIITGGSRFAHDDPEMSMLMKVLNRNMGLTDGARAAFFMPWLSKYFPWFIGWKTYINDANYIFDFWMKYAKNAELNYGDSPNVTRDGFFTAYLDKIRQCKDPQSSFYKTEGVKSFATVLQDIYIAGSETTATTLQWMFLYLAAFPSCQRKVAEEVLQNLGHSTTVTFEDKYRLPYTEAFIKEVLRFSTLAPLGMLHSTTEDVEFHGYFIPKDTIVMTNVCAVHYDKTYWEEPHEFNPERFLSEDGKKVVVDCDGYMPFSIGKRFCPGAELAKQTLFLSLVCLIQKFEVIKEPGNNIVLLPNIGVSAMPCSHKLIFVKRKLE